MTNTTLTILSFSLPFLLTTLGALLIFCFFKPSPLINTIASGSASGIMLSASIWSLLVPAVEQATTPSNASPIIPVGLGFLFGTFLMLILDICCTLFKKDSKKSKNYTKIRKNYKKALKTPYFKCKTHKKTPNSTIFNKHSKYIFIHKSPNKTHTNSLSNSKRAFKLFSAITLHNIPEGLSVGFAIGSAIATNTPLMGAFMFALGISLQNLPEGLATAIPIKTCTNSKTKAFLFGTLSGVVEPIFAIIGFFLASHLIFLQPWLLSISAGAMIYATIKELLPDIYNYKNIYVGLWSFIIGFLLMMTLDLCL